MASGAPADPGRPTDPLLASNRHFSCSLSAVLLARVREFGGDAAVAEVLARAGITRPLAELTDIVNWISYDEAASLWRAGAQVTHHPRFARAVGEDAARRLNSSPVATLLRSLGSPEAVYGQIAVAASKYSTVAKLDAVRSGPGFADIVAVAVPRLRSAIVTTATGPAACSPSRRCCSACRRPRWSTSGAQPTARPLASTA